MTDKGETDNNNGGRFRRETIHHQHRRSFCHDYHEAGLYMLTMVIEGRQRLFGTRIIGVGEVIIISDSNFLTLRIEE